MFYLSSSSASDVALLILIYKYCDTPNFIPECLIKTHEYIYNIKIFHHCWTNYQTCLKSIWSQLNYHKKKKKELWEKIVLTDLWLLMKEWSECRKW